MIVAILESGDAKARAILEGIALKVETSGRGEGVR
jgi:hypothetical protein